MKKRAGYSGALIAGFFSVFLLGWRGQAGTDADWVYGFLAVFWSLIMMLRLMTLTEPLETQQASGYLAQKIINALREKQESARRLLLESAFGGSFILFLLAGIAFAGWQVFCALFPADAPTLNAFAAHLTTFFARFPQSEIGSGMFSSARVFEWGQGFLLFLSFCMMAFVLRSHAPDKKFTRPALLVFCGYAAAGLILCIGLNPSSSVTVDSVALLGNGAGTMSYLLSTLPADKGLSLFDILLLESGVVGLGIVTFLLFVPLGYICLSAGQCKTDPMVVSCGLIAGSVLILGVFLTFTPLLCGIMALSSMAVFMAWGASEVPHALEA